MDNKEKRKYWKQQLNSWSIIGAALNPAFFPILQGIKNEMELDDKEKEEKHGSEV